MNINGIKTFIASEEYFPKRGQRKIPPRQKHERNQGGGSIRGKGSADPTTLKKKYFVLSKICVDPTIKIILTPQK